MRCKIVRFQKLMWRNMMRSTKSQKASVLHYSIDIYIYIYIYMIFCLLLYILYNFLPTGRLKTKSPIVVYNYLRHLFLAPKEKNIPLSMLSRQIN
jgi:hypothetical protein